MGSGDPNSTAITATNFVDVTITRYGKSLRRCRFVTMCSPRYGQCHVCSAAMARLVIL